jgi:hypothetical protein
VGIYRHSKRLLVWNIVRQSKLQNSSAAKYKCHYRKIFHDDDLSIIDGSCGDLFFQNIKHIQGICNDLLFYFFCGGNSAAHMVILFCGRRVHHRLQKEGDHIGQ